MALTIKHTSRSGIDRVFQANDVEFARPTATSFASVTAFLTDADDSETEVMDEGIVYIMNSEGATVARYFLRQEYDDGPRQR